ncbi:hypothetical protein Barb6_03181 [Bacteroidales bacterium Barb6]|nr:hypothetical protein Barb6_03181 [Bacteroidales bacterium Barb6]
MQIIIIPISRIIPVFKRTVFRIVFLTGYDFLFRLFCILTETQLSLVVIDEAGGAGVRFGKGDFPVTDVMNGDPLPAVLAGTGRRIEIVGQQGCQCFSRIGIANLRDCLHGSTAFEEDDGKHFVSQLVAQGIRIVAIRVATDGFEVLLF